MNIGTDEMAAFVLARVEQRLNNGNSKGLPLTRADLHEGIVFGFSEINQAYKLGWFVRLRGDDAFFPMVACAIRIWKIAGAYTEVFNSETRNFDIVSVPSDQPWLEKLLAVELGLTQTEILRRKIDLWLSMPSRNARKRVAITGYRIASGRSLNARQRSAYEKFTQQHRQPRYAS